MNATTIHHPDNYMSDLRKILSQGRKRIGLLIGSGAPFSVRVDTNDKLDEKGKPLIPDVEELTKSVRNKLEEKDQKIINKILLEPDVKPNIESILSKIRQLSRAIGAAKVHGLNNRAYEKLAKRICDEIGDIVFRPLPKERNPFDELASWVGGIHREHPIEIFTPNYDLLIEEAFERARLPYFDGFSGSQRPFFDSASVSDGLLPARWSRIWKIHGSLGWATYQDTIVRTGGKKATELIYPDYLKYDQTSRQPYSALFERLRSFLMTSDSLLLCSGFSFSDSHITSVLDEALASNAHTAILAFQYRTLEQEELAVKLACRRSNMNVYARDEAVISGIQGKWKPEPSTTKEWENIRRTFWSPKKIENGGGFLLGDFAKMARFFALARSSDLKSISDEIETIADSSPVTLDTVVKARETTKEADA